MKFSRTRGRPRKEHTGKDKGTPELQIKRSSHLTSEPLDLCLARDLITQEQHNAGIRLRWLYTLKMGSPTISAYSAEGGGKVCKYEDTGWLARKQAEYRLMLATLDKIGFRKIVVNTCIYNHMPEFLYHQPRHLNINTTHINELNLLRDGLEAISGLRGRKQAKSPPPPLAGEQF